MGRDNKYTLEKNNSTKKTHQVKRYGDSSFVIKKVQEARETLQKFPVPEKFAK